MGRDGGATLASYDGPLRIDHDGDVRPDGNRVLTTGAGDATALVHDATTGEVHGDPERPRQRDRDCRVLARRGRDPHRRARTGRRACGTRRRRRSCSASRARRPFNGGALSPDGIARGRGWRRWHGPWLGRIDGTQGLDGADGERCRRVVAFAPDGETRLRRRCHGPCPGARPGRHRTVPHPCRGIAGVTALATSPDGTRLAVLGCDARVRVLDLATREVVLDLPPASGYGWHVHYSPDGTRTRDRRR